MKTRGALFQDLKDQKEIFSADIDQYEHRKTEKKFLLDFRSNVLKLIITYESLAKLVTSGQYTYDFLKTAPEDKQEEAKQMLKDEEAQFKAQAQDHQKWVIIADKALERYLRTN
jgi:hypothetical protein